MSSVSLIHYSYAIIFLILNIEAEHRQSLTEIGISHLVKLCTKEDT